MSRVQEKGARARRFETKTARKRRRREIPRGWSKLHKQLKMRKPEPQLPRDHGQMESIRKRMLSLLEAMKDRNLHVARGKKGKGARRPTKKHPWGL